VARGSRTGTTTIDEPALGALGHSRVVSFSDKWVNKQVNKTALPTPMWPEPIWLSGAAVRVLAKAREAGRIHF
jgi:hypothetical protein